MAMLAIEIARFSRSTASTAPPARTRTLRLAGLALGAAMVARARREGELKVAIDERARSSSTGSLRQSREIQEREMTGQTLRKTFELGCRLDRGLARVGADESQLSRQERCAKGE